MTSVWVSSRGDDEALVALVVLALLGGQEARADVAQLRARARARRPARRRRPRRPRTGRGGRRRPAIEGTSTNVCTGRWPDVAGGLEAGGDHAVDALAPARSARGGRWRRRGSAASPRRGSRRSSRTCAGGRPRWSARRSCARTFWSRSRSSRIARSTCRRVRLLLRDPHVDGQRLVGERDREADAGAHLLDHLRDLLLDALLLPRPSSSTSAGWASVPSAPASEIAAARRASVIGPIPPIPACMNGCSMPMRSESGVESGMWQPYQTNGRLH